VEDEGNPGSIEARTVSGQVIREALFQLAVDLREIYASLFKDATIGEYPACAPASSGPFPCVFSEALSIDALDGCADGVLQFSEEIAAVFSQGVNSDLTQEEF
jgi:hypothetical protein